VNKFDVTIGLERARDARKQWNEARREFDVGYYKVVNRLIHEGARAFMSAREMAVVLDVPSTKVRALMKQAGLNTTSGKRALSEQAAKALQTNAALMGVKPHEMDLTSPLAYLPMGDTLRRELETKTVSQVTELPIDLSAAQLAAKLTDAGLLWEEAVEWVNEVIEFGEPVSGNIP
jgi:hypothetical protein